MDRTCEKCKKSVLIVNGKYTATPSQLLTCGLGPDSFTACQVACTDDYFEPTRRAKCKN